MKILFHQYKYYPYERELAKRELAALSNSQPLEDKDGSYIIADGTDIDRLVYFSRSDSLNSPTETIQARLERSGMRGKNRQSTRYSAHGLHEYKGKFNPQIAKAILNIFRVERGDQLLDPFCGSGTSLVECTQIGVTGTGIDINPLAVFIANAKQDALQTPVRKISEAFGRIERRMLVTLPAPPKENTERHQYLSLWFHPEQLFRIEHLREAITGAANQYANIFLTVASNLLREYSLQDPGDLRIRRRTTPVPERDIREAFKDGCRALLEKLTEAQKIVGVATTSSRAVVGNCAEGVSLTKPAFFDAAITSPPYAMALPYIDTQRLSLVWLDLVSPSKLFKLESDLVGSRELRGHARSDLLTSMRENRGGLPAEQHEFCVSLERYLSPTDGFRRKAVPILLYRYFRDMHSSFRNIRTNMKARAPFALIVGHNHTVLGGVRRDIDTPHHLASLASAAGWQVEELLPLQTYRRYGSHSSNAVEAEALLVLRNK